MTLWVTNIEKDTLRNKYWRKVLHTSKDMQVVVMSVPKKMELGWEVHRSNDQFFRVEKGTAIIKVKKHRKSRSYQKYVLTDGMTTIIPTGMWHNVINKSRSKSLQMYTIYSPPHHPPGTIDKTHEDELRREKKSLIKRSNKKRNSGNRRGGGGGNERSLILVIYINGNRTTQHITVGRFKNNTSYPDDDYFSFIMKNEIIPNFGKFLGKNNVYNLFYKQQWGKNSILTDSQSLEQIRTQMFTFVDNLKGTKTNTTRYPHTNGFPPQHVDTKGDMSLVGQTIPVTFSLEWS